MNESVMADKAIDVTVLASVSMLALVRMGPEQSRAVLNGLANIVDAVRALDVAQRPQPAPTRAAEGEGA